MADGSRDFSASRQVPYVDLTAQYLENDSRLSEILKKVFESGNFVSTDAVRTLEAEIASYCGVSDVVTLNSGTDALILGLRALDIGPGDEVITAPNSFVASAAAIVAVGATPVFADVAEDQNIDPAAVAAAITPQTRAIMPVHLTGRMCDMKALGEIAERHGLFIIEDAAQAMGSRFDGRLAGTIGDIGCFSAHPLKNFNAAGDAGFVVLNDPEKAQRIRLLRNHGLVDRDTAVEWGTVSRMDVLQAEILRHHLTMLDEIITKRRKNAEMYRNAMADLPILMAPCRDAEYNSFHTFVIQTAEREELKAYLAEQGIGTAIHYPVPIHLQPAARDLGYKAGDFPVCERQAGQILSLPIHQNLSGDDLQYVAGQIRNYFEK